ncbi:Flagellar motor rotation protein MotB [Desulfamplus magnetovallimortis]|uniref:Flagellar motor rotation protein MotB n=1 Tax=Desulfamplus magnetovallimortis TaxID=1246637 RepID=L0R3S4_9BACT|nr:OmpA family protein [Desulfamplus magnetovallimortis]CCO06638.1 Flagellar motor rotation protein MotB [Desulfamplus magnetovallimortis BW-1]SLM32689.1 Flagellar motor rotation protein MotB [Desulfamplus magnetovallimortis]
MKTYKIADNFTSDDDEGAGWLMTYADLVTLLLVFFVLLYSISSTETERFAATVKSIKSEIEANSLFAEYLDMFDFPDYSSDQIPLDQRIGLTSRQDILIRDVNKYVTQNSDNNNLKTFVHMGKIIIRIDGSYVFKPGLAVLNKGFIPVLGQILDILDRYPDYNLNIKGHTDDVEVASGKYASNWELSSARATEVLKFLIKNGIEPQRLTATGYGSTIPVVSNTSDENRAKNRRVEFVLEKEISQY